MKKLIVTLAFAFLCLGQQSAFAAAAAAFKVSPISSFAPLSKAHELALAQRKISARITVQGKPKIEFPWGVIKLEKRDATTIISIFYNDNLPEIMAEIKIQKNSHGNKLIMFRLSNDFHQLETVNIINLGRDDSYEFVLTKEERRLTFMLFGDQRNWTVSFDPSAENLPNCFQDFDNDPYAYSDLEEEEEKSNHADSAPNQRALALPDISAKFGQSSHYAASGEPRAKSSSHSSRSSGSSPKRPSTRTPQSPIASPRSSNASTGRSSGYSAERSSGSAASRSRSHSQQESERSISEQPLAPGMSPVYWVLSPLPLSPSSYLVSVSPSSSDPSPVPVGPSPHSHAASPAPMPFPLGAWPVHFFPKPQPVPRRNAMHIHQTVILAAQGIQLPQPVTPHPNTNVWLP